MPVTPQWSPQQEAGLGKTRAWAQVAVRQPSLVSRLWRVFGFAGTGKTTLVNEVVGDLPDVLYCAPTGKAAGVLRQKGCRDAMTIHQALYRVVQRGTSKLEEMMTALEREQAGEDDATRVGLLRQAISDEEDRLRQLSFYVNPDSPASRARLIVVDECSMVGSRVASDLVGLKIPLLLMGDPFQLQPVRDTASFMEDEPDVLLTDVHRQARESGILRLATDIREGRNYQVGEYGSDCRVVRQGQEGNRELVVGADQMLVGTNASVRDANYTLRRLAGREGNLPLVDDKLICRKNNHQLGLTNGSMWRVTDQGRRAGRRVVGVGIDPLDPGDCNHMYVDMHATPFSGQLPSARDMGMAEWFEHGMAITVHKSQGSQWDRVYMLDESRGWGDQWLYTGVTRAAQDLTLVSR